MKLKKVVSMLMVATMSLSLIACNNTSDIVQKDSQTGDSLADVIPKETVTLDVYSQLANYSGELTGWFAKVLLDKFNVKINIINNGDGSVFETRMESDSLGDLVTFGNATDYQKAANAGKLLDWNEEDILSDYGSYIETNMSAALDDSMGKVYGLAQEAAYTSGTVANFGYHPDLRYDLYTQIGSPEIGTLEDYVDVLKKMKEACPTSDSGKETYGASLFKDWDGSMVMFVKSTATNFFGVEEFGNGLYDCDTAEFQGCLDEDGYYLRSLKFYNQLYREGLLDPDSSTQNYDACMEDYKDGAAFFCIFDWMGAEQYNTDEHKDAGKIMLPVTAKEQDTTVGGVGIAGGKDRYWAIGEGSQYPELCMSILNWLSTVEGRMTSEYGPQELCWTYNSDGEVILTDFGMKCKINMETEMKDGYTGKFSEGDNEINSVTWSLYSVVPTSKEKRTFNWKTWPESKTSYSQTEQDWMTDQNVSSEDEYMMRTEYSIFNPTTYIAPELNDDLKTIESQLKECVTNGTWKAMYAESDEEFDKIVTQMQKDAKSYGYDDMVAYYTEQAKERKAGEY